jgi:hypothetical protein
MYTYMNMKMDISTRMTGRRWLKDDSTTKTEKATQELHRGDSCGG